MAAWYIELNITRNGFQFVCRNSMNARLDRVLDTPVMPRSIMVDHRTEFQSRALEDWDYLRSAQLDFIRLDKPVENAFIEWFNGRLRDEYANVHHSRPSPRPKLSS